MSRSKASGYSLTNKDASIVLGMVARGDRDHDIAAWFGVNQGRIAEVKDGKFGSISAASAHELPPKGPPGVKGKRLRAAAGRALEILSSEGSQGIAKAVEVLQQGLERYDANEA
jgi:hypothetical protein